MTVPEHLVWPLKLSGSSLATVEQGTPDEIQQAVALILTVPRGALSDEPLLGVSDPTFVMGGANPGDLDLVIQEWEPRADSLSETIDDEEVL